MPRWPEDSRHRLVESALTLFTEQGYAAVTVDDIAERSGVSARTFFRHFPDKEEVLFADDDALLPLLLTAITASTERATAEEHMRDALGALADALEPQRETLRHRQVVIDSQISLAGRELAKQARWQQSVMTTLVEVGYDPDVADLMSAIGFAVFRRALHSWLAEENGPALHERVDAALLHVRSVWDATPAESPSERAL
jgi:AcrR family transcriptional regulator